MGRQARKGTVDIHTVMVVWCAHEGKWEVESKAPSPYREIQPRGPTSCRAARLGFFCSFVALSLSLTLHTSLFFTPLFCLFLLSSFPSSPLRSRPLSPPRPIPQTSSALLNHTAHLPHHHTTPTRPSQVRLLSFVIWPSSRIPLKT